MAAWDTAEGLCPPSRCHQAMPPPFVGSHAPPSPHTQSHSGDPQPSVGAERPCGSARPGGCREGPGRSGVRGTSEPVPMATALGGKRRLQQPRDADKGEGEGSPAAAQEPPSTGQRACGHPAPHPDPSGCPYGRDPRSEERWAASIPGQTLRCCRFTAPQSQLGGPPAPASIACPINIAFSSIFKADKSLNQRVQGQEPCSAGREGPGLSYIPGQDREPNTGHPHSATAVQLLSDLSSLAISC